jgi:hydrogenase/urease accessory protein HupE
VSAPLRLATGAAVVAGLWLLPATANAHDVSLSCSDFVVEANGTVRAQVAFSRGEAARLAGARGGSDPSSSGGAVFDREAFRRRVTDGIVIRADGEPCDRASASASDDATSPLGVSLAFRCKAPEHRVEVELLFLGDLPSDARHLLQIRDGAGSVSESVSSSRRSARLIVRGAAAGGQRVGLARELLDAVRIGVEHILTGWDHLLFLAALVLGTATVRGLVGTISAFTVAHSITLALAALGVVAPSVRWVEPTIAASIVCVAAENLLRYRPGRRWPVALAFGLVHGFGFAGALRELALDRNRMLPTLVGFNAGVEVGQLGVLAVALHLLATLRKRGALTGPWNRRASASIGAIGAVLLVTRICWP